MSPRVLGLLFLAFIAIGQAATLEGVRLSRQATHTRLVFDLDSLVSYKTFTLNNPHRLVFDLRQSRFSRHAKVPDFPASIIQGLRHAPRDNQTLRLVLDLTQAVNYQTHLLSAPPRLVVDLWPKKKSVAPTHQKATHPSTTQPRVIKATTPPSKKAAKPKIKPAVAQPTRTHPHTTSPVKKVKRDIVVAIDAGHGGQDSGAIGRHKTKEKNVTLAIARRLAALVNKEPGMTAYLTRNKDIFLPLRRRINLARQHHADMFISIHADSFTNTHARGASVFVLSERGASSEAAKLLADKENAADLAGGISLEDKDDLLASVLLDLSQDASLEASLEVANDILAGLKRIGHVHKKYVQSAAFVVLKSPDIPSVLVETAFISNPDEEWKLKDPRHQQKLARAILSGIRHYFRQNPLPDTQQPQQHIVSRGDTLNTIAQRYQVSVTKLKQFNHLSDSKIKIGDILLIP